MAKSIRSKRMRKFRAIKRTINKPKEDLILRHVVSGGNDPTLPPLPVLPHQKTSGFSFWSVIDEYKRETGQDTSSSSSSSSMSTTSSATTSITLAEAASIVPPRLDTGSSSSSSSATGTDMMVFGDESNAKLHKPLSASAIKKRKSKEKLRKKGIRNTKRFNL